MTRWLSGLRVALRSILRRNRVEDELAEELQFHLEREIGERVNAGARTQPGLCPRSRSASWLSASAPTQPSSAPRLAARLLTTMLFDVQPVDAQVYLGVVALLGAVALAAGYLPAWRAASIDPVAILKAD